MSISTPIDARPETSATHPLRIGTRGSVLALWQANAVRRWMLDQDPARKVELSVIASEGDRDKVSPLAAIGGRGVFATALQQALLAGEIDAAVHCTKDLPGLTPAGLELAAFPDREIALDALVSRHGVGLRELPSSPTIGTSSRRRAVQILAVRPDARIVELRGNIDTRLRKSRSFEYDAIVLAAAGLSRMGWEHEITEMLHVDWFTPAPGQGVLAIETRLAPNAGWMAARALDDADVRIAVNVERAFLRGVGGGCTTPIGAYAQLVDVNGTRQIRLHAMLADEVGTRLERINSMLRVESAAEDAFVIAQELLRSVQPSWAGIGIGIESASQVDDPLFGAQVLVTASPDVASAQSALLRSRGASPIVLSTVHVEPALDGSALDLALADVAAGKYDWVMITSANAVPAIASRSGTRVGLNARVAVVGERTADALSNAGIVVSVVPSVASAEGLLDTLAGEDLEGKRILLLLSDIAQTVLADGLRMRQASVDVVTAYRTVTAEGIDPSVRKDLRRGDTQAVLVSSPSAAHGLVRLLGVDIAIIAGAFFIAIGETTAEAMRSARLPVHAVASQPTPAAMIEAWERCYVGGAGFTGAERISS